MPLPVDPSGKIVGDDYIPVAKDAKLVFDAYNPAQIGKPLIVKSGANSIKWSYELNTVTQQTIGGEVVQVLSAFVGPMTIEGITGYPTNGWTQESFTPVDEMVEIIDWFLVYMHWAGATVGDNRFRNERAIRFRYPIREWDFYIMPTELQGFKIDKSVTAVPWAITAEVVSDNALDYFEATTMSKFTEPLNVQMLQLAITPGFEFAVNPFVNPSLSPNDPSKIASKLGAEFQGLIAAWSTGNFATWGYSALGDNSTALPSPKNSIGDYQKTGGLADFWSQDPPPNRFHRFEQGIGSYWIGGVGASDYNVMGSEGYQPPGSSGGGSPPPSPGSGGGTTGTGKCNIIAIIGDSITVRMANNGDLVSKLKANGWKSASINAQVGETVEGGITVVTSNPGTISKADAIVIALGTNPGPDTPQGTFSTQIQKMISAIRKINANATIYWMNAYTKVSNYDGVDGALATGSGYTLIDWRAEAKSNPSTYTFDSDGIHPSIPQGTSAQADFLAKAVACVPAPPASSGPLDCNATKCDIVFAINSAFEEAGIPGWLAVADAIHESALSPNADGGVQGNLGCPNGHAVGLFQVIYGGRVSAGQPHAEEVKATSCDGKKPFCTFYPASDQISDAVRWWSGYKGDINFSTATDHQMAEWVVRVQGSIDYSAALESVYDEAKQLVKECSGGGYRCPFAGASAGRIDQGVDYSGTGPIRLIGRARICRIMQGPTPTKIWPPWISYQLLDGSHKGAIVYVAENISISSNIVEGKEYPAGTIIATFTGGIETGFAADCSSDLPCTPYNGQPDGTPMPGGKAFARFMKELGCSAPSVEAGSSQSVC